MLFNNMEVFMLTIAMISRQGKNVEIALSEDEKDVGILNLWISCVDKEKAKSLKRNLDAADITITD